MNLFCKPWKHPFCSGCQTATESKDIQTKASTCQIHHLKPIKAEDGMIWDSMDISGTYTHCRHLLGTQKHIIPYSDLFIRLCIYLLFVDTNVHMYYQYHLSLSGLQHTSHVVLHKHNMLVKQYSTIP